MIKAIWIFLNRFVVPHFYYSYGNYIRKFKEAGLNIINDKELLKFGGNNVARFC